MNENVITFFQDIDKTINIFSISIELRTLLIICLVLVMDVYSSCFHIY